MSEKNNGQMIVINRKCNSNKIIMITVNRMIDVTLLIFLTVKGRARFEKRKRKWNDSV